jgi:hypothetical protein
MEAARRCVWRDPLFGVPSSETCWNLRDLTEQRLRRGIFCDVEELIVAIGDYIDKHNDNPKPLVWTAKHPMFSRRPSVPVPC